MLNYILGSMTMNNDKLCKWETLQFSYQTEVGSITQVIVQGRIFYGEIMAPTPKP
jgi:hypothetical protein